MKEVRDGHGNRDTVPLCSTPACAVRGVEATHGKLCVYCDYSTNEGKDSRAGLDWLAALRTSASPRMAEPRKRLAAIEQKRPRVNAAERAMLERGHPASWPSNEGED
jgi:hypothetical protein